MDYKMLGIVILIIGIIFLFGAIEEMFIWRQNVQDDQEQKDSTPFYEGSETEKENEDLIAQQFLFMISCYGLFILFFIVGAILMVRAESPKPQPQQTIIYQTPPPQPVYQQPVVPQYQQPPPPQPVYQQSAQPPPQQQYPCPHCGNPIDNTWNLCPQCGEQLK